MHELKNVKLTQEQDFNRENHMAQIFSHLVMPGEISKDQPDFPTFCQKAPDLLTFGPRLNKRGWLKATIDF